MVHKVAICDMGVTYVQAVKWTVALSSASFISKCPSTLHAQRSAMTDHMQPDD